MRGEKLLCEKSKSQISALKSPVGVGCIMPVFLSCPPFQTDGVTKQKITKLIQNDNPAKTNTNKQPQNNLTEKPKIPL